MSKPLVDSDLPLYRAGATPNGWEGVTGYIGCPCRLMGQSYSHHWLYLNYANGGLGPGNSARTALCIWA